MILHRTAHVVARDHPAFEGHFPGRPLLPGVALLAEALAAIASSSGTRMADWTLEQVKFTAPVAPGAALDISHQGSATGAVRFEIREGARVVATGVLARVQRGA